MTDLAFKSIPIAGPISDIQARLLGIPSSTVISAHDAYRLVVMLRRAIKILCNAVADMPFTIEDTDGNDVTNTPQVQRWQLKRLIWKSQAAVSIYGAFYWLIETNRYGLSPIPRWLLPPSVLPQIDPQNGLTGFTRTLLSSDPLPLSRVVYFWEENLAAEVGPGTSDVAAALIACGLLYSLDEFAKGVFERGGMKLTLLQVEGNPAVAEVNKTQAWWNSVGRGVKKAWETLFIKFSVKPVVIGSDVKDTMAPELMAAKREDVLAVVGVPFSLVLANAASYATANQDWINLYTITATPAFERMAETINAQFLSQLGLRLVPHPEKLECYQQFELQKASAISTLTGEPILTRAEGRDMMGLEPEAPALPAQPSPIAAAELRRWKRKAARDPYSPFSSDVLDATQRTRISAALKAGEPIEPLFARELRALAHEPDPELAALIAELRALRDQIEHL